MNNPKYPTLNFEDDYKIIDFRQLTKHHALMEISEKPTGETYYQIWKKMDD